MANSKQIMALLKAHINGDEDHFFSVAMQLAASEAKHGHGNVAIELRKLIDDAKIRRKSDFSKIRTTPISKPRGELAELLEVSYPKNILKEMILADEIGSRIVRIIKEQRNYGKIQSHGLTPRRKLLLVGPPGTGKTLTASVLAGELGIPLFLVRLDQLITKYMGETAGKLRVVFDAIRSARGVYFFDEFDAIGSQRGMANDVGEIRRVLNSFLQMLDNDDSNSVIVAATNHPEILDYALFRRFDDVIEYSLPTPIEVEKLLRNKLTGFLPGNFNWEMVRRSAEPLSYAEIVKAAEEAMKNAILHDRSQITVEDLNSSLKERFPSKK